MDRQQRQPRQIGAPRRNGERPQPRRALRRPPESAFKTHLDWLPGTAKFCGLSLVPLVLLVLLSVGVLYFRLLQGPVSLKFMAASVEQGINNELTDLKSSIDDIVVTLTDSGALEFRIENLRFIEADGDLVVAAPQAAMELSYSALWTLRATPARVELIEPRLFMSYTEDTGLSLRFSPSQAAGLSGRLEDSIVAPSPVPARGSWPAAEELARAAETSSAQPVDFSELMARLSDRLRRGSTGASSYLREFGFRDATVVLDAAGHTSVWQVPRLNVDLDHYSAQSVVSGAARISSQGQIWSLAFEVVEADNGGGLSLKTSIDGLVPRWIGNALPQFAALRHFDMPIAAEGQVDLARDGDITGGSLALSIGSGGFDLAEYLSLPLAIDDGRLNFTYDAAGKRLVLAPSHVSSGDSSLTLKGFISRAEGAGTTGEGEWRFALDAEQGVLGASEFGIPPLPIDKWQARGMIAPQRGLVRLDGFTIAAGGGQISVKGELAASGEAAGSNLEAEIGAMPAATLKVLWPRGLAEAGREWVGQKVQDGRLSGGTFRYLSGPYLAQAHPGATQDHRMTLAATLEDVVVAPLEGMAPISLSRALVRIENQEFEVVAPEGTLQVTPTQPLVLKSGRFTIADLYDETAPAGEVSFATEGKVDAVLALLEMPAFERVGRPEALPETMSGEVTGHVTVNFPLIDDLKESDVRVRAKAKLTEGRAVDLIGDYDLKGATIDFDLSETAVDAKGEVLIDGVVAQLNWQRIFGADEAQQPPIRVTATLDEADRRQLGLDLGDAMHGEAAIEVTVHSHPDRPSDVRVRADLTNADVGIEEIAWRKPTGRSAFMEFDILYDPSGKRELKNFRLEGDDLSVEGALELGKKKQIVAFAFPKFWLNLVTRLEVSGTLNSKNVWEIQAKGPTYDGRAFFRTLYSIPGARSQAVRESKQTGIDLSAEIDNVLGFGDVNLKGMKLKVSERNGQLTALQARGTLSGGKPLTVDMHQDKPGARQLIARTSDAGEAFKLVGFYPNMSEGNMRLEVNLDGRGPAQKTGILWVETFKVLGDPVISEVAGSADAAAPSIDGGQTAKRRMVRQVFQFDQMRAPFSVGHGQFVLEDAYLRGPLQGATIRGRVDYSRQALELGGTYIPLQGLNNAFGAIPVLGELLSGPRQEGIFGVTYAIQGSMESPQVVVHPLSVIAPGIFREMFQMAPPAPSVQPRQGRSGSADPAGAVRSSSSPAAEAATAGAVTKNAVDGWSSQATPARN